MNNLDLAFWIGVVIIVGYSIYFFIILPKQKAKSETASAMSIYLLIRREIEKTEMSEEKRKVAIAVLDKMLVEKCSIRDGKRTGNK